MKITIFPPLFLNEKGKRDNNEDSIFPLPNQATENDRLFVVCDGVGGADKGEVASELACRSFAEYFAQNPISENTEQYLLDSFEFTQQQFDKYFEQEPRAKGMGTTLVLLYIHANGLLVAHCGDSRLYHISKHEILFKTFDHSQVNELLKLGIITAQEAETLPKNRISRAIQGNSVNRTKPDIKLITDIESNDYLFLCTDGVHGCLSDKDLIEILTANQSDAEKMNLIHTLCEANSKDNYSAYLIKIADVKPDSEPKVLD